MATKLDSGLVVHDGGLVKDVLDTAKPLANYTALRAYNGGATGVRITAPGVAGFFQRLGTVGLADNGGTVIVDAIGRTWERLFSGAAMALWFGADKTGVNESSAPIQAAMAAHKHVVVEPGVYRCDTMLEINTGNTLELLSGATLRRYAAYSASTDPVVWLKNSGASFYGAGQAASTVFSENRCPKGVVRIGHRDMTESHATVTYCALKEMTISGNLTYGQTTGEPDVALYIPNPQFNALANYFHNIFGIRLQRVNIGLFLSGWANGNTISNIQGYQIGNTALGLNKNAFIYLAGALDNAISNVFFHASPNSIGLLIDNFDNASNGGVTHSVYANSFSGMVFEQGGGSALGLKSLVSGGSSFYEIRHNTAGGISVPEDFSLYNTFIGLSGISTNSVGSNTISVRDSVIAAGEVSGGSIKTLGDSKVYGANRSGNGTSIYLARKVKANSTVNASTVSFTLSNAAQASLWRYGYIIIKVAGGDNGNAGSPAAWYMYRVSSLNNPYPSYLALKDSGGDTASFTVTDSGGGVITVSSTQDSLICEMEFGFNTNNVNIT